MTPFERGQHEAQARLRRIRALLGPDRRSEQEQLAGFLSVVTGGVDVSNWRTCSEMDPESEQCPVTAQPDVS